MKKIIIHPGESLERAYIELVTAMVESETVCYADFNGKRIYSDKTIDEAFKTVMDKDYMSFIKEKNEEISKFNKKEAEIRKNIPSLIKKYSDMAIGIIPDSKLPDWYKLVPLRVKDIYHGYCLESALKIGSLVKDYGCDMKRIKKEFESQNHSGVSASITMQLISKFIPYGNEIVKYINMGR